MEVPAQELVGSTSDQSQTMVMRGKRTKRQRPPSPFDHSPTTSASTDDEEEDLANCLILLAQGGGVANHHHQISAAKSGFYVYECKTCNRTFQSFQALGGHRASHKRPKTAAPTAEEENIPVAIPITKNCSSPPLSVQLAKIHECSICGSEFSSGQALGGHMRRHRASEVKKGRNVLQLDLNLPAPEDHEFQFNSAAMVFSAPPLVNCHY